MQGERRGKTLSLHRPLTNRSIALLFLFVQEEGEISPPVRNNPELFERGFVIVVLEMKRIGIVSVPPSDLHKEKQRAFSLWRFGYQRVSMINKEVTGESGRFSRK